MKRLALTACVFIASMATAQTPVKAPNTVPAAATLSLKITGGDVKTIKVDQVVIVKKDLTVVSSFPFTVGCAAGAGLYFWQYPVGVVAVDRGEELDITAAPRGPLTISLKVVGADWDARKFVTKFAAMSFSIGVPEPTPPIDPPVPPDPPKPPAPKASLLSLVVVHETEDATPAIAAVLQDLDFWKSLNVLGHRWAKVDKDQKELGQDGKETGRLIIDAYGYRPTVEKVGMPALLVFAQGGSLLQSLRLPDSTDKVRALVKEITGK